jgi:glycosyltransferase involved in cell wall biosynthesis
MSAARTPVSIVIPAFNQLEYCRQCVTSIRMNTTMPHRLILVDNGSTDGVAAYFDSVPDAVVVHSPANRGFAGGVNLGMAQAEGHVLLLNSDTLVPRGWLERLEKALLSADDIGMVGPRSNCVSGSQQIDGLTFGNLDEINAFADDLAARHPGELRDVARLVGFCVLIRDRVVAEVGLFDESYGVGNFEDDDYCLRILRAGYRLCVAEEAFVFHYGSRTFVGMGLLDEKWQTLLDRNGQIFREKWNARPEERSDAVQQSRLLNRRAAEALERNDFTRAIRLYKEAIALAPSYELNYNDLGVALWQMGDPGLAIESFKRALKLRPSYEEARANFLIAAAARNATAEAEAFLSCLGG